MRKYINLAFIYAVAAICGGVFYREFTKFNGFKGVTALGKVHTHLFLLGMFMFLIVAILVKLTNVNEQKQFKIFFPIYNVGTALAAIMLVVRGVPQVLSIELSVGMDAAISGIAGLAHVCVGVGIVLLFLALKKAVKD